MDIENGFEKEFLKFVSIMDETKALENVILIGSWAEYVYAQSNMLTDFKLHFNTIDVDFLVKNLKKPNPAVNFVKEAEAAGFAYTKDRITNVSKFIGKDNFEVEFLIQQKGSGIEPLPTTNLGVNAQQLTHLDVLTKNTVQADLYGKTVTVPFPEAYAIQKMIINDRRGLKQERDLEKIYNLYPHLSMDKFNDIYKTLSVKEKKICEDFMREHKRYMEAGVSRSFARKKQKDKDFDL